MTSANATDATDHPARADAEGPLVALARFDERIYQALAAPLGPPFDRALSVLTNTADHSKISLAMAAGFALFGGSRGRRAAATGLVSVALTSATANAIVKPLARRRRPARSEAHLAHPPASSHHVPMPESHSFPSGHTAAATAFATGVATVWPSAARGPALVAVVVGYSRVHAGVHFPGDVVLGAVLGSAIALAVGRVGRHVRAGEAATQSR
jgi:undecaprenyl-diphosphatase